MKYPPVQIAPTKKRIVYTAIALSLIAIFSLVFAHKLEVGPFSPRRPSNLPANAIWIDGPLLPLTFAHGGWLGCEKSGSNFDRCILIGHNDRMSGGDGKNQVVSNELYLSCKQLRPLETDEIILRKPPNSMNMWVGKHDADNKWADMVPAAFLQNGDVLIPASEISQCSKMLNAK
jgi:hypothetical protein